MKEVVVLGTGELKEVISSAIKMALEEAQSITEPRYYSPGELSQKFPFKESTIQTWMRNGLIGHRTATGKMMATYKEVEEFLTKRHDG